MIRKIILLSFLTVCFFELSAQSKLVKKIERSEFFVTLLLNKSRLQSFTDPSIKGSISAYLNAVNAKPQCVKLDSFLAMQNEYYRIIDGVNGSLDGIISVIESINTIQDLRNVKGAKQFIDSINKYASAAPSLFVRLIRAEGQVTTCEYGSGILILKEVVELAMPFINQIFQNRIAKVKLALIQKINQLKFDRMTSMWDATALSIRSQSGNNTNLRNVQVISESQGGVTELTREGAFRELGLSPIIQCYTSAQIKQAYNARLESYKEIWNDPDFVKPEEALQQRTRLIDAYGFLLNLFADAKCDGTK